MPHRHRRLFAPVAVLLISLPLLVGLAWPDPSGIKVDEQRDPAPSPDWPTSWRALPAALHQGKAWLDDRFGFRRPLQRARAVLVASLLRSGDDRVFIGRDDRYFLLDTDAMLAQSAGHVLRTAWVAPTADMIAALQRKLAARGIPMLIASPPNSATVYPEALPKWARNNGGPTEYDLLYAALTARGLAPLDLRPVLRAEKPNGNVYFRHDSHWTQRGGAAALNAVVRKAGLPDWQYRPGDLVGPPAVVAGGDLARLLGLAVDATESVEVSRVPALDYTEYTDETALPNIADTGHPGPTIMILGDSFTRWAFKDMLAPHAGRVIWLFHRFCRFDWHWFDALHPDQVWYMTTERQMLCPPGAEPTGLDGESR